MLDTMATDVNMTNLGMADSEAESMIVHNNGDATVDDLLGETDFETDVEIETIEAMNKISDSTSLKLEARAKTRLLSRSHSVNDLNNQTEDCSEDLKSEPPRRNSSGEYPPSLYDDNTPSPKPSPSILLSDLDLSRYKGNHQHRSSLTPTSNILQLSPVTVQYSSVHWKSQQPQEKEDNFSLLLHTTAERVLTKLKSRQQDLGGHITRGQKSQRKHSQHGLQLTVPRKLQPILRDGSKTPRSDSDMRSLNGDGDFGPLSAA